MKAEIAATMDRRWAVADTRVIYDGECSVRAAGHLARMPDGGLLLSADCTPPGGGSGTFTILLRSADSGRTWTEWCRIEHPPAEFGNWSKYTLGPAVLPSGRLVMILAEVDQQISESPPHRFTRLRSVSQAMLSDDGGKTWKVTEPMATSPFFAVCWPVSRLFVTEDGTLVGSFRGCRSQEEMDHFNGSVGLIRSRDGGETWGDVSLVREYDPATPDLWFNEHAIQPLPDGRWVCFLRCNEHRSNCLSLWRSHSSDQGHTWSEAVRVPGAGNVRLWAGEPKVCLLPDGGLLCAQTCGSAVKRQLPPPHGIRYEVSYDAGETWAYTDMLFTSEPGKKGRHGVPYFLALDEDTVLAAYHRGREASDPQGDLTDNIIAASWLKKVPAAPGHEQ